MFLNLEATLKRGKRSYCLYLEFDLSSMMLSVSGVLEWFQIHRIYALSGGYEESCENQKSYIKRMVLLEYQS